MKFRVFYSCVSHIGKIRRMNQDNFICGGRYLNSEKEYAAFPLTGCAAAQEKPELIGIFDGMGGEERGEIASLIAAREASEFIPTGKSSDDLLNFCKKANEKICRYAEANEVYSMGTTAALLEFTDKSIGICNIGDSKIFRYSNKKLKQISVDHVVAAVYGMKPPLSQNLGIPPSEMLIEPYIAKCEYNDGDIYLICSDGLTDMVTREEIERIIRRTEFDETAEKLLNEALANGGRDNITLILCRVQREKQRNGMKRIFGRKSDMNV